MTLAGLTSNGMGAEGPMRVIVVGGGIVGVTTAYFLNRRGHEVLVLDRAEGVGTGASFANGGLLTPSMADPWNAPGCWRVLLASLFRSDAPLQLRVNALPGLLQWGVQFLLNSRATVFERNALTNLRLALYSRQLMATLRQQTGFDYGHGAQGSLRIFRDTAAFEQAQRLAEKRATEGLTFQRLTPEQTVALEPVLAPLKAELAGGMLYQADENGDAHRFCVSLAQRATAAGVEFRFNTQAGSLETRAGGIAAIRTQNERLTADRYIVAAGSLSTELLRDVGIALPVRPVKGYSLTLSNVAAEITLRTPIIDDQMHAVVVPFGNAIRVAGTAEFAGYDHSIPEARVRNLMTLAREVLPHEYVEAASKRLWCGLRPMSADGVPIVGATPIPNLFVNTGHGHLGWTLAAGSAQLITEIVSGDAPTTDPAPVALTRFAA